MDEIIRLKPEFKIKKYGYEKGNYYIISNARNPFTEGRDFDIDIESRKYKIFILSGFIIYDT